MRLKGKKKIIRNFLAIFLSVSIIYSASVVVWSMSSGSIKIQYLDKLWDTKDKFKEKWYTGIFNESEKLELIVDLSDYYKKTEKLDSDNTNEDIPFDVNAKVNSNDLQRIVIEKVLEDSNLFSGKYKVRIPMLSNSYENDIFEIVVKGKEDNELKIPVEEKIFTITRIKTTQSINFSLDDGSQLLEDIYDKHFQIKVKLSEEDLDLQSNNVIVNLYKKLEGQEIDDNVKEVYKGNGKNIPNISIEEDGKYKIEVRAIDKTGKEFSDDKEFGVDKNRPSIEVVNEVYNDKYYQDDVIIRISDNYALDYSKSFYELDGVKATLDNSKGEKSSEIIIEGEGSHNLVINAVDSKESEPKTFDFIIDKIDPEISITGIEENSKLNKDDNKNIRINVKDDNISLKNDELDIEKLRIEVTRNGETYTSDDLEFVLDEGSKNSATLEYEFSRDGDYNINITAEDNAGRVGKVESFKFSIDTKPPKITAKYGEIDLNKDIQYFKSYEEVVILLEDENMSDNNLINVFKNGVEEDKKLWSFTKVNNKLYQLNKSISEDDSYKIIVNSTDEFENSLEVKEYNFVVDNTAPEIKVNSYKKFNKEDVDIVISSKDTNQDINDIIVKKDNKKLEVEGFKEDINDNTKSDFSYKFVEEGKYYIEVKSKDKAGNEIEPIIIEFVIDKSSPIIEMIGVEDKGYYKEDKKVDIYIKDSNIIDENNSIEVTKDGKPLEVEGFININEGQRKFTYLFKDEGFYEIKVKSKDAVGFEPEKPFDITFTIDKTEPKMDISGVDINKKEFLNKNVFLSAISTDKNHDINTIKVLKDGLNYDVDGFKKDEKDDTKRIFNYTFEKEGLYEIEINSKDKSNNEIKPINFSFVIDKSKPIINVEKYTDLNNSFKTSMEDILVKIEDVNSDSITSTVNITKVSSDGKVDIKEALTFEGGEFKIDKNIFKKENGDWDDGVYTIRLNSKDKANNEGDEVIIKLTLDSNKPIVTFDKSVNGSHYNVDKDINIITEDDNQGENSITVLKDGKSYDTGGFKVDKSNPRKRIYDYTFKEDGSYKLTINSKDYLNNTIDEPIIMEFVIDKKKPIISISNYDSLNNSYLSSPEDIDIIVDELNYKYNNVNITYRKGNSEEIPLDFNSSKEISKTTYSKELFEEDGIYTLTINSKDKAGNEAEKKVLTFTIDKISPSIDISGVENDGHYNLDKYISIQNSDTNHSVNNIKVTRDEKDYNIGSFQINGSVASIAHTFTGEGVYKIEVNSIDKAGNSTVKSIKLTIDKTSPVITPIFRGEGRVIKNGEFINKIFTPEFNLSVSEDEIDYVELNGQSINPGNIPMASEEIEYTYKVHAKDKANNTSEIEIKFTVDTTLPEVKVKGILNGFFNEDMKPEYDISDKNLDKDKSNASLNGSPFESGTNISKDDNYNLKVLGTDLASNTLLRNIIFSIDKEGPVVTFKEALSGKYFNEDLTPEFFIEDLTDYSIISLILDGEDYQMGDPITTEGKHVLYIEVKDKANNIKKISVEFIIDKTAPEFIVDGVADGKTYYENKSAAVKLKNPQDKIKSVVVNGEAAIGDVKEENGQQVLDLKFNEVKDYEVTMEATDEAGNDTVETLSFKIKNKNIVSEVLNNKTTSYPIIGIAVAIVIVIISAIFIIKKKRKNIVDNTEE
ncbi:hypothetical protein [Clostridium tertium]|uniref:Y_Y_Y domain protein n=1 Tax=Clostridium tertium TaxID=1559 RepID=A0A6N3A9L3_9CLOT